MYLLSSRKLQNPIILSIRGIIKSFKDNLKHIFQKKSIKTAIHKKVCNPRKTKSALLRELLLKGLSKCHRKYHLDLKNVMTGWSFEHKLIIKYQYKITQVLKYWHLMV